MDLKSFESLPHSSTCRLINFEKADVVPGLVPKTFFLIVAETKPWATMKVELHPLIYIRQPEYWGIEVVGCQPKQVLALRAFDKDMLPDCALRTCPTGSMSWPGFCPAFHLSMHAWVV